MCVVIYHDPVQLTRRLAANECGIQVDFRGPPLTTNWYRVWGAAIAAAGMCIRERQDGIGIIQGRSCARRYLYVRHWLISIDGGSIITLTVRKVNSLRSSGVASTNRDVGDSGIHRQFESGNDNAVVIYLDLLTSCDT